jgi:hypothetical protein
MSDRCIPAYIYLNQLPSFTEGDDVTSKSANKVIKVHLNSKDLTVERLPSVFNRAKKLTSDSKLTAAFFHGSKVPTLVKDNVVGIYLDTNDGTDKFLMPDKKAFDAVKTVADTRSISAFYLTDLE